MIKKLSLRQAQLECLICTIGETAMLPRDPIARLPTHEVNNMPPHMGNQDLWKDDQALQHWTKSEGGACHAEHLANVGQLIGLDETFEHNRTCRQPCSQRRGHRLACYLLRAALMSGWFCTRVGPRLPSTTWVGARFRRPGIDRSTRIGSWFKCVL